MWSLWVNDPVEEEDTQGNICGFKWLFTVEMDLSKDCEEYDVDKLKFVGRKYSD